MTTTNAFRFISQWHHDDDYRLAEVISSDERDALLQLYPEMSEGNLEAAVVGFQEPADADGVSLAGYAWSWIAKVPTEDTRDAETIMRAALTGRGV
jgi:alpha-acetolactate decarboxylase